ncbi:MAG TPA: adenylyl-sulfate kinase [Myxococcales bacterium]|jgi:adenylylsulfate kinase
MLQTNGFTIWLTGMPGVGKSTLATYLGQRFKAIGRRAEVLDHDDVAPMLTKELGTTKDERLVGVARLGYVARLLSRNDTIAIAAAISPHREARDKIRKDIGRFVEVWVDCETEKLIERDSKGLYKKALAGEIPNFIGVTEPYDTPQHAEVHVHTDTDSVEASGEHIVQALVSIGYLKPEEARQMTGKRLRPQPLKKGKAGKGAKPAAKAPAKSAKPAPKKVVAAKPHAAKPAPKKKAAKGKK